jgi:hypothetical protein
VSANCRAKERAGYLIPSAEVGSQVECAGWFGVVAVAGKLDSEEVGMVGLVNPSYRVS